MCSNNMEEWKKDHLFLHYKFFKDMWMKLFSIKGELWIEPPKIVDFSIKWGFRAKGHLKLLWNSWFFIILWNVWMERNWRIFSHKAVLVRCLETAMLLATLYLFFCLIIISPHRRKINRSLKKPFVQIIQLFMKYTE